jgi:hypothetical protein
MIPDLRVFLIFLKTLIHAFGYQLHVNGIDDLLGVERTIFE